MVKEMDSKFNSADDNDNENEKKIAKKKLKLTI